MVVAGFWIQYVGVGAKEVAIRYGYEQYYFHLFAARPLLYFALGALGVTVLQWAGGLLSCGAARDGPVWCWVSSWQYCMQGASCASFSA